MRYLAFQHSTTAAGARAILRGLEVTASTAFGETLVSWFARKNSNAELMEHGMSVELSEEADYKLRYATEMARIIGTFEGCMESADDAWDARFVNGSDLEPEEDARTEISYWRESM